MVWVCHDTGYYRKQFISFYFINNREYQYWTDICHSYDFKSLKTNFILF